MTPSGPGLPELRHTKKRVVLGDIALYAEAYLPVQASKAAPVLLLSAAEEPSIRWSETLRRGLALRTGGTIWFDTRDCGRSSWVDEPYQLDDLAGDAVAVLDAFGVERAHVLGRSMGGEVAQRLGLSHGDRVESLMLLSTTPGHGADLASPAQWLIEKMSERLFADVPVDSDERAEWLVDQQEWFAGPVFGFDREAALEVARQEVDSFWRGPNLHGHAVVEAADLRPQLATLSVPTMIIHGTADPVYPVEHAQALADLIPGARLILIEGLGHLLPEGFVPDLLDLVFPADDR